MKRSRFTHEQITTILAEYRAGTTQSELSRTYGVSTTTISQWHVKFGSMGTSDVRRLRQLEAENGQLHRIVATQAVELLAAKDIIKRFS